VLVAFVAGACAISRSELAWGGASPRRPPRGACRASRRLVAAGSRRSREALRTRPADLRARRAEPRGERRRVAEHAGRARASRPTLCDGRGHLVGSRGVPRRSRRLRLELLADRPGAARISSRALAAAAPAIRN
jgi:hypothetical protein